MIGIFNKTEIIVHLAQECLDFPMVSRSLARRILSNIDKFKVVFLDFANIETIGQGFADEIFRVFKNKHPEISVIPLNTNEEIDFMIKRATNTKF
ncbi:STAS-like domain-containing protein [Fusobacterium pseudoperiodonticum]